MNQIQQDVIKKIEILFRQRLNLLKHYLVESVCALRCLERGEVEAFSQKLDERGELTRQMDLITCEINVLITQLDECYSMIISALSNSSTGNNCLNWCTTLAGDTIHTQKLLRDCAALNTRLTSHAKVVDMEIRSQLNHIQSQRKIRNGYATKDINLSGMHISYQSK